MSGTAKTVLIVAGAGVGVFVLLKVLSPAPLAKPMANPGAGTVQGLIGLGASALGKLFSSGSNKSTDLGSDVVTYGSSSASYLDKSSGVTDVIPKDTLPGFSLDSADNGFL